VEDPCEHLEYEPSPDSSTTVTAILQQSMGWMRVKTGSLLITLIATGSTFAASPPPQGIQFSLAGDFFSPAPLPEVGNGWFALSPSDGGFDLLSTRVEVKRLPHDCSGTIIRIAAAGTSKPVLLVRGSPRFKPGPLDTVLHGHRFLNPGERLSFKLKWGDSFYLGAYGTVKPARGSPQYTDYQLILTGRSKSQVVVDIPMVDLDAAPTVVWAGDLDRDDTVDLLMKLPCTDESVEYVLFLSSLAANGELVRKAATFSTGGC